MGDKVHVHNYGTGLTETRDDAPILKVNFRHFDHVPSWKRRTQIEEGTGWLECTGHQAAGWLSLTMGESYSGRVTPGASKVTMFTLPRDQVAVLRDMLNRVLDGDEPTGRMKVGTEGREFE